jgi:hypothetical protein
MMMTQDDDDDDDFLLHENRFHIKAAAEAAHQHQGTLYTHVPGVANDGDGVGSPRGNRGACH